METEGKREKSFVSIIFVESCGRGLSPYTQLKNVEKSGTEIGKPEKNRVYPRDINKMWITLCKAGNKN